MELLLTKDTKFAFRAFTEKDLHELENDTNPEIRSVHNKIKYLFETHFDKIEYLVCTSIPPK